MELIRQFYDEPRCFRISGAGEQRYVTFSNAAIKPQPQGSAYGVDLGERRPVFDIQIISQKSSPFNKIAQNELAKEMYAAGFFDPSLSDQDLLQLKRRFWGKQSIVQKYLKTKHCKKGSDNADAKHVAEIIDATQDTGIMATARSRVPAKIKQMSGTAFRNAGGTTAARLSAPSTSQNRNDPSKRM